MPNLLQDLRFSARSHRKSPSFAVTAILTLALGVSAVTSIFSVVDSVLLRPFGFTNPNQLVMLRERQLALGVNPLPDNPAHALNWQANTKTLSDLAIFQNRSSSIAVTGDHPEIVNGLAVAPNFFSVLDVQPALGRNFLPSEAVKGHNRVAILAWDAWQRYFHGDKAAIGQTIQDGGTPITVIGVLPEGFNFPRVSELATAVAQNAALPYQIFRPLVIDPNQLGDPGNFNYLTLGRLRPGMQPQQAQAELNTVQTAYNQAKKLEAPPSVLVQPLLVEVTGHVTTALWLLLGAVTAVLLIGCGNLANLQLARAISRERELAVRAALGANRNRLLWSAFADSLLLATIGGALGILLSFAGVRLFIAAAPSNLPRLAETHVSWPVLCVAAALSVFTSLFFGLLPALRSLRVAPQSALQTNSGRVSSDRDSRRTRNILISTEVSFTLALLIITGLLVRSFSHLLDQDRAFDSAHITLVSVYLFAPQYGDDKAGADKLRAAFTDRALASLAAIPGVQSTASTSERPMAGETWIDYIERPDHPLPAAQRPNANMRWVSPGYASTLRIPLVAGRDLQSSDRQNPKNVLLSQQAAHNIFPGEDPIGRAIAFGGEKDFTVVGVLADARINDLKTTANMVYVPYWENPGWRTSFLVRSSRNTSELALAIRQAIWNIDSTVAIPVLSSLDEQVSNSISTERFQTLLLTSFGIAALLIAILGIYGVLAYSVSLRRQEFGVRIALGSTVSSLMTLVGRQVIPPVGGGILVGLALAAVSVRWVGSLLYQTSPLDPVSIAIGIALLLIAALVAAIVPARRAARTDPVVVLRNE